MKKIIICLQFLFVILLAGIIAFEVVAVCYFARRAGGEITVTEINDIGEGVYYGTSSKVFPDGLPDTSLQEKALKEFIIGFRGLDLDPDMFSENGQTALFRAEGKVADMVKRQYEGIDWDAMVGKTEIIIPENEIILKELSEGHWSVQWRELVRNSNDMEGVYTSDRYYNGIMNIRWRRPTDEYSRKYNPLGINVYQFDFDLLKTNG